LIGIWTCPEPPSCWFCQAEQTPHLMEQSLATGISIFYLGTPVQEHRDYRIYGVVPKIPASPQLRIRRMDLCLLRLFDEVGAGINRFRRRRCRAVRILASSNAISRSSGRKEGGISGFRVLTPKDYEGVGCFLHDPLPIGQFQSAHDVYQYQWPWPFGYFCLAGDSTRGTSWRTGGR
jgi:hypothetical protein